MALNWAMLNQDRSPVPLPNELTISTLDAAIVTLIIPDQPPSASDMSGGSGGSTRWTEEGTIFLTDQRLIFSTSSPSPATTFQSLSVPLLSILSTQFNQPLLSANNLTFTIKPSPDGGLTSGTTCEVRLKDQGLFSFVAQLEKTRERALYMKRETLEDPDAPPLYGSSSSSSTHLAGDTTAARATPSTTNAKASSSSDNPPGYDA